MPPKDPSGVWILIPAGESSERPGAATNLSHSELKSEMPPKDCAVVRIQSRAGDSS